MTVGSTTTAAIEAVDASARSLYRRARAAGADFADIATVVRSLHTVLKHLRVEAEDLDSLLNTQQQEASVYARQLTPIVEDCDFTLKQLDTILEKYGTSDTSGSDDAGLRNGDHAGSKSTEMESREKDMITLIRTKLANQKTNIDIFLDTVQLHNPTKAHPMPPTTDHRQLDAIKDKVDAIASRLFHSRGSSGGETEEELWQQFCSELIREGFSSQVLHRNKEVLRAYIRELDSNGLLDSDSPPSVRGLLPPGPPMTVTTASYLPPTGGDTSPKEMYPAFENEKFAISVKEGRLIPARPDQRHIPYHPSQQQQLMPQPPAPMYHSQNSSLAYDNYSSPDDDSEDGEFQQMALISTRDLMSSDRREHELLAERMGAMHLSPQLLFPQYSVSPGSSPNGRYLPPPLPPGEPSRVLSSSPASQAISISPRFVPPLSSYSTLTPPPAYGSSPVPAQQIPSSFPGVGPAIPAARLTNRLAPDSYGQEIPPDAKWTKINRRLVSLEVLERAGVRYEARPAFVAILGILTKAEIAEYARRSAEVRRSRYHEHDQDVKRARHPDQRTRGRTGSTSDSESDLWDESDTSEGDRDIQRGYHKDRYVPRSHRGEKDAGEDEKSTKVYPFIVPPPSNETKVSPSSTVQPKSILKNKNENHVRFDKDGPVEISATEAAAEKSPRNSREESDRNRRRHRDRDRDYEREKDRDYDRERRRRRERERDDPHRDRERDRDRDRERDRDRDHHTHRRHHGTHSRDSRDIRDPRDPRDRREDRTAKKSALRETLGAVGIGGAAASLLSVLTEAAVGL